MRPEYNQANSPLTAMRGYVETLHRNDAEMDRDTRERYFSTLERETQRLDRIVNDLLDLARLENAVSKLEVRDFDVRRLFEHVVDCLAAGRQPDPADLAAVGYLMRTTAVYGSGKFGLADREAIADRAECAGPFRAEMLSVWLTRAFTIGDVRDAVHAVPGGNPVTQRRRAASPLS